MEIVKLVALGLLCLSLSYASTEDEDIDARPDYMKISLVEDSKKKPFFGFSVSVFPEIGVSSLDLAAQKEELEKHKRGEVRFNPNYFSTLTILSQKSATNPTVVLWLHGSNVDHFVADLDSAKPFINKGFALATFDRFHVYDAPKGVMLGTLNGERYCTALSGGSANSWNQQDSLPLSTEIMMTHKMCMELKARGTERIILAGHSRGGILVNECAKENVAEVFESVGVLGYVAIGALPLMMEPIVRTKPVVWISGAHDTICPPDLMMFYYKNYLGSQSNVKFHQIVNMGHNVLPQDEITILGSIRGFFKGIYKYRFEPSMWSEIALNSLKRLGFCLFGIKSFTYRTRSGAQSFINACSAVEEGQFRPLVRHKSGLIWGKESSINSYPDFIKANMSLGVHSKEPIKTKAESDAIVETIVDHVFGMVG